MEAKNGFFAESVEEGLERIRKETGRRVADTGFRGKRRDTRYFVTDDGRGFLCKRMHGRLFFMVKKHSVFVRSPRRYFIIPNGRTRQNIPVAKCVYCAFVLGRWDENCEVGVKDGDEGHLEVGNLVAKGDAAGVTSGGELLARHAGVYRKKFRWLVGSLAFQFGFRKEACEDIAQDAFLYACSMEKYKGDFAALWIWNARQRCKTMLRHTEEEWDERMEASCDTLFEYPFGDFLSRSGHSRRIWEALHEGWDNEELMEHLKIDRAQCRNQKHYLKVLLKKALKNDIYFMNHRCEII